MPNNPTPQFIDPTQYAQLQADMLGYQRKQQLAAALSNQQYIPNSGIAGVLAGLAGMLRGRQLQRQADESVTDLTRRYFDMQNQQAASARAQQIADDEMKFRREILAASEKARAEAKAKRDFPEVRFDAAAGGFADPASMSFTPDQAVQDFLLRKAQAGRSVTSVNLPATVNENAFQKSLGEKDAGEFVNWRDSAMKAQTTLADLNTIEKILGASQTGKAEELSAMIGQYLGTPQGANMQAFKAAVAPMIRRSAEAMKGALSDKDIAFLQQAAPSFGNDPRANAQVIGILRRGAEQQIGNYRTAQEYVNKRGTLAGFEPMVQSMTAQSAAPAAPAKAPHEMSDAELLAALGVQ